MKRGNGGIIPFFYLTISLIIISKSRALFINRFSKNGGIIPLHLNFSQSRFAIFINRFSTKEWNEIGAGAWKRMVEPFPSLSRITSATLVGPGSR